VRETGLVGNDDNISGRNDTERGTAESAGDDPNAPDNDGHHGGRRPALTQKYAVAVGGHYLTDTRRGHAPTDDPQTADQRYRACLPTPNP